jgi:sigma-B regulation protein RsbU (phosphoserine phosphatase)
MVTVLNRRSETFACQSEVRQSRDAARPSRNVCAPIPADEAERLAELHALQILDTPDEARFERIVAVASQVLRVPMACVALIDADRLWLKSRLGVSPSQIPREGSFCAHAILEDGPLVVPDARLDLRFRDSSVVVGEPFLRFYAGHRLAGPGGHYVGTLCVVDRVPRTLDERDVEILARLAAMAEHELGMVDLIRVQRELLDTKTRLLGAQRRLNEELADAAAYVYSLLPAPLGRPVRIDWQFVSSSALGGDLFGYRWLDEHRLAIYLLDVMGHGVGAALLATWVESALRGGTLAGVSLDDPAAVLASLNFAFPMEQNGGRFFSIWFGIYDVRDRSLSYANAGHPPGLLFDRGSISKLGATGTMVGITPDAQFQARRVAIPRGSRLYLYSDGAYEVPLPGGDMLMDNGLQNIFSRVADADGPQTGEVLRLIREAQGCREFKDDVSLLEVDFD